MRFGIGHQRLDVRRLPISGRVLLALAVAFCGLVAPASALAGSWGTPTEITTPGGSGSGQFFGVSCTGVGDCTAVGV